VGRPRDRRQHSPNAVGSIDRICVPVARVGYPLCGARDLVDEVMLREAPLLERSAASTPVLRPIRAGAAMLEGALDRFPQRLAAGRFAFTRVIGRGIHVRDTTAAAIVNARDDSRRIVPKRDEFVPGRDDRCDVVPGGDDCCGGCMQLTPG
jgi:hypothetical protein